MRKDPSEFVSGAGYENILDQILVSIEKVPPLYNEKTTPFRKLPDIFLLQCIFIYLYVKLDGSCIILDKKNLE